MNKVYVTWADIEEYLNSVVTDITQKGLRPTGVYGLPRGGLIFATWLSYKLNIPLLLNAAKDCIIVDDIADTGKSLCHFRANRSQFNDYYITTMFSVEDSVVKPDYYYKQKQINEWVVYPYER